MSITLITGVPGSGKTLKAVWDHLRLDVGKVQVSLDEWGREFKTEYKVFTNINSLKIDHEFIEGGGTWSKVGVSGDWKYEGNPEALRNWHNWAKPGTKIYFDEFQKFWPPRPNGAPVPPDVQALDTHRHMGVDFVVITQNCRNVDRHLLGLVDRHLHVRRVSNMPLAVVYEWDHASVNLNYKNAMTKSPWRYPKKAYTLYKSAELHTKQSRKLPGLLWFIIAGFAGAAYAIPSLKERLSDRIGTPIPVSAPAAGLSPADGPLTYTKDGIKYTVETTTTQAAPIPMDAASSPALAPPAPVLAGCIRAASRCSCFDTSGVKMDVEPKQCLDNSAPDVVPKTALPDLPHGPRLLTQSERDLLAFMHPGTTGR
ncbi:MAG: hypothetical protein EAZ11_06680 [Curvibacter sp.]|nr:MAG: hypothetical protein EAZ11_06680 [Curvibacter sp.]